ncbi:16857_t:CDS:2, partial [Dentiscutata heterogama]
DRKVRVLKMTEISPLMTPVVKDYYENDIIPIYSIKYGIEQKKFEKDLDCLLIKSKETFKDKLHHYDSDILPFVNYSREWRVFVEGGYGEKADKFYKSKSIVIEKVLDKKRVVEMAENTFKKHLIYVEDDD